MGTTIVETTRPASFEPQGSFWHTTIVETTRPRVVRAARLVLVYYDCGDDTPPRRSSRKARLCQSYRLILLMSTRRRRPFMPFDSLAQIGNSKNHNLISKKNKAQNRNPISIEGMSEGCRRDIEGITNPPTHKHPPHQPPEAPNFYPNPLTIIIQT